MSIESIQTHSDVPVDTFEHNRLGLSGWTDCEQLAVLADVVWQ